VTDQSPEHDAQLRQRIAKLRQECGCIHAGVAVAIAISLLVKTVVIVHSRLLANYLERDRSRTIRLRSLQADFGPPWVKKLLADNTTGAARSRRVRVSA
jgi:hypothetical protein